MYCRILDTLQKQAKQVRHFKFPYFGRDVIENTLLKNKTNVLSGFGTNGECGNGWWVKVQENRTELDSQHSADLFLTVLQGKRNDSNSYNSSERRRPLFSHKQSDRFISAAGDASHTDPTHGTQCKRSRLQLAIHCSVQTSDHRFNRCMFITLQVCVCLAQQLWYFGAGYH